MAKNEMFTDNINLSNYEGGALSLAKMAKTLDIQVEKEIKEAPWFLKRWLRLRFNRMLLQIIYSDEMMGGNNEEN